jgi:hypothetical protein
VSYGQGEEVNSEKQKVRMKKGREYKIKSWGLRQKISRQVEKNPPRPLQGGEIKRDK